jgi:CheY-like chemotaxis protein
MTSYNILIAEDNLDFVELLKERISSFDREIEVIEASNGYEALDKLKEKQFDLLITDFNMPVMNGMELVKSIKSIPDENRPNNVIMLSAFLEPGEPSADLRFVQFLPKDDFKGPLFDLIESSRNEMRLNKIDNKNLTHSSLDNENIRIDIIGKNFVDLVKGKDISLAGVAVYVPHFIIGCEIGESVECKISLPHRKEINAKGTIKHLGKKNEFFFGIEFTKMDKRSEDNLKEFVKSA